MKIVIHKPFENTEIFPEKIDYFVEKGLSKYGVYFFRGDQKFHVQCQTLDLTYNKALKLFLVFSLFRIKTLEFPLIATNEIGTINIL